MANYLERVASSAGRRAAVAKPPASGPPVLPAGRDFSIGPVDPFAGDEEQFVEATETLAPPRTESRAEIASTPKSAVSEEPIAPKDTTNVPEPEPKPNPRPTHERLSSESPFTVQIPRTLRPIATANVPTPTPVEEAPRVRASTTVGPEEFKIEDERPPVATEVKEPVTANAGTTPPAPRPQPLVSARVEEQQPPVPVRTEVTRSDVTPIPRVDRVDGPPAPKAHTAEPSPPPALPVHLPPVANNSARQEQSRIHIGSLEVLVNNHPRVTTVRPATPPSRTERLNLEKRYLDRFRLRH